MEKWHDLQGPGIGSVWFTIDGGNNLDGAPLFVDQANGYLRLQPGSLALYMSDGAACSAVDLDGFPRTLGAGCDKGAFEFWGLDIALTLIPIDGELSWDSPGTG